MIVNPTRNGWEVIYHRGHALLAAQVAARWGKSPPARLVETIAAISHHDDLEREWKADHLTPAGTPLDYTLNPDVDVPLLRDLVESALYRGRWVALLISIHLCWVQEPRKGQIAELDAFLAGQRKLQARWRKELGASREEVEEAHAFLTVCDNVSLLLCQRQIPERGRAIEIGTGPDGRRYDLRQRDDETILVEPWPFGPSRFQVSVEACDLNRTTFKNQKALVDALRTAPIRTLSWNFAE